MVNVPCGFIAVQDSDNTYIPFFVKVRSDDIIWNDNNTLKPLITSLTENKYSIEQMNPLIYKFSAPVKNKVSITDRYIYFKINNKYYRQNLNLYTSRNIDINRDGINYSSYFRYSGETERTTTPNINDVIASFNCTEYIWECRINNDGFVTAHASIPITNKLLYNVPNREKYYCYSKFNIEHTAVYMDYLTLDDIELPIPILYNENLNIQVSKYSDNNEFTNSFISTSFDTLQKTIEYNTKTYDINMINNIKLSLNGINKFPDDFEYQFRDCMIYITVSGYMPTIKNE